MPTRKTFHDHLRLLGFETYNDYLRSELWSVIKAHIYRTKGHTCNVCKRRRASAIHHKSYTLNILKGDEVACSKALVPICRTCHKRIHKIGKYYGVPKDGSSKRLKCVKCHKAKARRTGYCTQCIRSVLKKGRKRK